MRDFEPYSVEPGCVLFADLFVDPALPVPPGVRLEFMR